MTTPIATFQDILDAMAHDPSLEAAMRQHVLDQEFRQLPAIVRELQQNVADLQQAIAQLTQVVQDYITTTDARLSRIESDITELKAGHAELKEEQSRMRGDITELKEEQTRMQDDITELKEGQARMQGDITELKEGQTRMQDDITELKRRQVRMQGTLARLDGADYERKAARRASRLTRRHLGMTDPRVIYAVTIPDQNHIPNILDQAVDANRISEEQSDYMENADIILVDNDNSRYAVAEASITLDAEDVRRAHIRAAILAAASAVPVAAVVIGAYPLDACRQAAAEYNVTVITLPE